MLYYKYEKAREGTFGMARKIGFSKVPWLGVLAGLIGGKLFRKMPPLWLKRIFAVFILYGAWRYLT